MYENSFLQDFKEDFKNQANVIVSSKKTPSVLIYQAYQPSNVIELKEYMFMLMSKKTKRINDAATNWK